MKSIHITLGFFLLGMSFYLILSAQEQKKVEREYRIDESQAPAKAVDFIQQCPFENKIKWYAEESQDGKTVEAKTIHRNYKYSIEFDTLGNNLDVEKTVKFESLEEDIYAKITTSLNDLFLDHKIKKTQMQWKGEENVMIELITTGRTDKDYTLSYEVELKGRKDGYSKFYEVLFDKSGKVIKTMEIVPKNSDDLEY